MERENWILYRGHTCDTCNNIHSISGWVSCVRGWPLVISVVVAYLLTNPVRAHTDTLGMIECLALDALGWRWSRDYERSSSISMYLWGWGWSSRAFMAINRECVYFICSIKPTYKVSSTNYIQREGEKWVPIVSSSLDFCGSTQPGEKYSLLPTKRKRDRAGIVSTLGSVAARAQHQQQCFSSMSPWFASFYCWLVNSEFVFTHSVVYCHRRRVFVVAIGFPNRLQFIAARWKVY